MFLVDPVDIIAVHRAHALTGRDSALAEVRRRWPAMADRAVDGVLDRVLAIKVDVPAAVMLCDADAARDEMRRARQRDRDRLRRARVKAERDGTE